MQVTYDGAHSVLIGDLVKEEEPDAYGRDVWKYKDSGFRNTWDYYGLIPMSVPVIAPPDVQENTVEVPGSNGIVDLSDVLLGHPLYYNRSGSLEFYVDHTHPSYTTWENAYDRLLNDLHGANKKLILTDAKGYYYEGRLKVNQWKSDKLCSQITLDYNFAPYKRMLFTTYEDWLWNPFDFVNGVIPDRQGWYIRTVGPNTSEADKAIQLNSLRAGTMPVVPDILIDVDTYENYDELSDLERPHLLFCTGNSNEVQEKLQNDEGYRSDIRNSERVGSSLHFLKHDPLITIGAPGDPMTGPWWGIKLINPRSYNIKMTIDFRQGRL